MRRISATDAARRFADFLDKVEETGEEFVVMRRGRPVATIGPAAAVSGADVKEILRRHPADALWADDLRDLRGPLTAPASPWTD